MNTQQLFVQWTCCYCRLVKFSFYRTFYGHWPGQNEVGAGQEAAFEYIFFLLKDFIDSFKDTFSVISTHDPILTLKSLFILPE